MYQKLDSGKNKITKRNKSELKNQYDIEHYKAHIRHRTLKK